MKYNELKVTAQKKTTRVGRGISAGRGKTAGRGTKGQKARTGFSQNPGFAGGSNPLMQRLPKLPGFKSHRKEIENIMIRDLEKLKTKEITAVTLREAGLISSEFSVIKLLGSGEIKKAVNVKLPLASSSAIEKLEAVGGSFSKVERLHRVKKEKPQEK